MELRKANESNPRHSRVLFGVLTKERERKAFKAELSFLFEWRGNERA